MAAIPPKLVVGSIPTDSFFGGHRFPSRNFTGMQMSGLLTVMFIGFELNVVTLTMSTMDMEFTFTSHLRSRLQFLFCAPNLPRSQSQLSPLYRCNYNRPRSGGSSSKFVRNWLGDRSVRVFRASATLERQFTYM